ncbi:MAG: DUF3987 domain-containing protein [Gemmatimonadetes bacterium]|nr:DUF3987 domain-containing protein [Gemmatimonadota bacterium]
MSAEAQLMTRMAEFDLRPPEILFDHKLHRFKAGGDKGTHRSGSGWYRAYTDQRGAVFGCHRTGVDEAWQIQNGETKPTEDERREWKERAASAKADREKRRAVAQAKAQAIWKGGPKAEADHPYLQDKGIKPTGLRQTEDGKKLIAPMRGDNNEIVSLQTITADGVKRFMADGWIKGTMASIGSRTASRDIIYITEGWSTGASINEATGAPVAVAYYADNLAAVTKRMAEKFPDSKLIIAADNDFWTKRPDGTPWNPGVEAARRAAEETDAQVAIPTFPLDANCQDQKCKKDCDLDHPTDYNDLRQLFGDDAVRRCLIPRAAHEVPLPDSMDGSDVEFTTEERETPTESPKEWPEHPRLPGPPEPDRLPVEVLPPVLRDMALTIQRATQAPSDAAVAAVLGAVSVAVVGQALVEICPRRQWRKPVHTFVGIEMPSGTGKSPLIERVKEPIERWEAKRARDQRPERRAAAERLKLAEERLARARKKAANQKASDEDQSAYQNAVAEHTKAEGAPRGDFQLLIQDATEEELVRIMADNCGRVACVDSEATLLEVASGRYGNGDSRLAALTHGWDGGAMRVNRVSRPRVDIPSANLALLVGIQPGIIHGMLNAQTMKQRGVLNRFIWVSPTVDWDDILVGADVPALDLAAVGRYGDAVTRLLNLPALLAPSDRVLKMSPEAQEGVYRLEQMRKEGMRPGGPLASIPGWAGKLPDHGARIAALLTVADRADQGVNDPYAEPIPGWAMEAAIRLVQAIASHVVKVTGKAGVDTLVVNARYVLDRALTLPEEQRTVRELHRACDSRPSLRLKDDFQPVLDDLVSRGYIRTRLDKDTGGRPSKVFEINPHILRKRDKRDESHPDGSRIATSGPSVPVSDTPATKAPDPWSGTTPPPLPNGPAQADMEPEPDPTDLLLEPTRR